MPYLIGLLLALGCIAGARATGLDRDRAFYPTLLAVVAQYYVLFAAMDGSAAALAGELAVMALFLAVMLAGFKTTHWWIVAGLAAHGVFDLFHSHLLTNHGVPQWWPAFCGTFDIAAAVLVAAMLLASRRRLAVAL